MPKGPPRRPWRPPRQEGPAALGRPARGLGPRPGPRGPGPGPGVRDGPGPGPGPGRPSPTSPGPPARPPHTLGQSEGLIHTRGLNTKNIMMIIIGGCRISSTIVNQIVFGPPGPTHGRNSRPRARVLGPRAHRITPKQPQHRRLGPGPGPAPRAEPRAPVFVTNDVFVSEGCCGARSHARRSGPEGPVGGNRRNGPRKRIWGRGRPGPRARSPGSDTRALGAVPGSGTGGRAPNPGTGAHGLIRTSP